MTDSAVSFALRLLGQTQLMAPNGLASGGDRETAILGAGKPLALIAYLSGAPGKTASRGQLVDLLWADVDRNAARHTLRQTLWYIKRRAGEELVLASGDVLQLSPAVVSDRDAFLRALEASDAARAVAEYGGDFVPGFAAPGGAEFEQWADVERRRLRSLFVRAAETAVRELLSAGRTREAVQMSKRVRDMAEAEQGAWRLYLESLIAADDRLHAVVEAERLEVRLALEEEPVDAATRAMMRLARTGAVQPTPVPTEGDGERALSAELVGREQEFARCTQAWDSARRGHGIHVHLVAPAGLGKTRLLAGVTSRLRADRVRVVDVRARQANRRIQYAVVADLVLALVRLRGAAGVSPEAAATLVAIAPGVSTYLSAAPDRSSGDDALRRRTLALQELVSTIAEDAPIAIIVDDLHWADAPSRQMIASLSAGVRPLPVLLLTAGRHANEGDSADDVVVTLRLAPLGEEHVAELVASVGQLPDEPWANALPSRLLNATGGSPLLVLETLQLALERQALTLSDGQWSCPAAERLDDALAGGSAIRQRLLAADDTQRSVLLLLAVLGTSASSGDIARVAGADGGVALHNLERRGLVLHDDDQWRVVHDEVADLAVDLANPDQRRRAHRECASLLESLLHESGADQTPRLLRAVRHRRLAGDSREAHQLFAQLVRVADAAGDRAAIRALARDVLSESPRDGHQEASGAYSATSVDALVRTLPFRLRANVPRLFAAGAVSLVVLLAASVQSRVRTAGAAPEGDAVTGIVDRARLPLVVGADSTVLDVTFDDGRWRTGTPINARAFAVPAETRRALFSVPWWHVASDSLLYGAQLSDDGPRGFELVQLGWGDSTIRVLTDARGDDVDFKLSPDGRLAAFVSARWDTVMQHSSIAVYDVVTGAVRRLTTSPDWDHTPVWSPDGSRVVYMRRYAAERPNEVCWSTVDGLVSECRSPDPAVQVADVLAWTSATEVIFAGEDPETAEQLLAKQDLSTGRVTVIDRSGDWYRVSPSGQFVIMAPKAGGASVTEGVVVYPIDRKNAARPLHYNGEPLRVTGASFIWLSGPRGLNAIDRLEIVDPPPTLSADGQTRLRVRGVAADGTTRVNAPLVQWRALGPDPAALVLPDGSVVPSRQGEVRVEASAGGYRADTVALTVAESRFQPDAVVEQWSALDTQRWRLFGAPSPTVDGGTLLPGGDQSLPSGVMLRSSYDASGGIGVEMRVQLPMTQVQWQSIFLELGSFASDDNFAAWSEREIIDLPASWAAERAERHCALIAPRGEGGQAMRQLALQTGQTIKYIPQPPVTLSDGKWHSVRLQIFPDGRCGAAIDGQRLAIGSAMLPLDAPYRVVIGGQSVGTTIRVGTVRVWQGERHDVRWYPSAATASAASSAATSKAATSTATSAGASPAAGAARRGAPVRP